MKKILLVEDNEMIQEMLSKRLDRKGYQVLVAHNGAQGVEMAHAEQPALILMDMSLPVLDGWQATRQLKAASDTSHIPIIALTAHAVAEIREQTLQVGCDDYEIKPVNFAQLLAKMEALLNPEGTA